VIRLKGALTDQGACCRGESDVQAYLRVAIWEELGAMKADGQGRLRQLADINYRRFCRNLNAFEIAVRFEWDRIYGVSGDKILGASEREDSRVFLRAPVAKTCYISQTSDISDNFRDDEMHR